MLDCLPVEIDVKCCFSVQFTDGTIRYYSVRKALNISVMKNRKILGLLCCAFVEVIFVSCAQNRDHGHPEAEYGLEISPEDDTLEFSELYSSYDFVRLKNAMVSDVTDVVALDSIYIVRCSACGVDENPEHCSMVSIFSKEGEYLAPLIYQGQDGGMLALMSCYALDGNSVIVRNSRQDPQKEELLDVPVYETYSLTDGMRTDVYDSMFSYSEVPVENESFRPKYYLSGSDCISPDRSRIAYVMGYMPYLVTLDLGSGESVAFRLTGEPAFNPSEERWCFWLHRRPHLCMQTGPMTLWMTFSEPMLRRWREVKVGVSYVFISLLRQEIIHMFCVRHASQERL